MQHAHAGRFRVPPPGRAGFSMPERILDMNFPADVIVAARGAAKKWDIPASVTLAQWALESGGGAHMPPGSANPFGIKARAGEVAVAAMTWEHIDGKDVQVLQRFRKFASLAEAFDTHGALLANGPSYAAARAVRHSPRAFAKALTGVYATDPAYGNKLLGIMDANQLEQFDGAVVPASAPPALAPVSPPPGRGFLAVLFEMIARIFARPATVRPPPAAAPAAAIAASPPWLAIARGHIGLLEGAGDADNPAVVAFYAKAGHPEIKHDAVPWCAAFVGAVLADAGLKNTGSLLALSYETWGLPLPGPALGCIGTKRRVGGGHVFFVAGANAATVYALGGNQSDSVSIEAIPRAEVTSWRWPDNPGIAPMAMLAAPLPATVAGAAATGKEA